MIATVEQLKEKIELFRKNLKDYKSKNYDEYNTRADFIDVMYPPKCPYEFSVLPIEILGNAYEQFFGKTIKFSRKTKFGHSIEIEEKPEVRKAGGVYYTPDYIVDYIVENTVGEQINGISTTCTPGPLTPGGVRQAEEHSL